MKMRLLTCSTAFICAVFIITGAVSGEDVKKAVGETVSFRPDKLEPTLTSITWKQIASSGTVKVIEWDPEETDPINIPHPRFKDITKLDEKTGVITITNLKLEHSGTYTIDINSKEQTQRFTLEVMERVPKPVIKTEESSNPDAVYLKCEYSGTIIWKNSAGETLKGHIPGEFLVKNTGDPENFYTCTFKNDVSEETSDRVYERDLFETEGGPWWIALIVIFIILLAAPFVLYKVCTPFHNIVSRNFKKTPCIGGILKFLDGEKKDPLKSSSDVEIAEGNNANLETDPLKSSSDVEIAEGNNANAKTDPLKSSSDVEIAEGNNANAKTGLEKEDESKTQNTHSDGGE